MLKDGKCLKYFCEMFLYLSETKLNEGVFVGPVIRLMGFDFKFKARMATKERYHLSKL